MSKTILALLTTNLHVSIVRVTYALVALAPIITVIIVLEEKSICDLMTLGSYTPAATSAAPNIAPDMNSGGDMVP